MDTNVAMNINKISKSFGELNVLSDLEFSIYRGECFGLLGPNGAGKSTTLKIILGHSKPDNGSVFIWGQDVKHRPDIIRNNIGVVAQFDSLDPDFSVEENLLMYGQYFDINKEEVRTRVPQLIAFAMLETRKNENVLTLSGGMRRRLSIARALINNPNLILLDEPTTGLDPQARHLLWDRLKELKRQGLTILLTTHFMDEAERLCDRIAVIDKGKLISIGSPKELIKKHIGNEVIEIYGDVLDENLTMLNALQPNVIERIEVSGETCFCYVHQPRIVIEKIQNIEKLSYLHRPANLEDVFLKLTGRDLRDE